MMTQAPETPKLSPSIAHLLATESPRHAWARHRLLGNLPRPTTSAQEKGRIFHNLLLEQGDRIESIDFPTFHSAAAKEWRDEARANGKLPVLARKLEEYQTGARLLAEAIAGYGYDLSIGQPEVLFEWAESSDHGDIECKGILDWIHPNGQLILDLKTSDSPPHPDACAAKLLRDGGVIQDWAYLRAVSKNRPDLAGRIEMVFLFGQTIEPYVVTPILCSGSMQEIGSRRWERAIEIWAECLARGRERQHWPPYVTGQGPVAVDPPGWALARELGEGI